MALRSDQPMARARPHVERASKRFPVVTGVHFRRGDREYIGVTRNMSIGGMGLVVDWAPVEGLPCAGDVITIELPEHSPGVRAHAEVVHVDPTRRFVGVRYRAVCQEFLGLVARQMTA